MADNYTPHADMTLVKGMEYAVSDEEKRIIYGLARRVSAIQPYQARLREWSDRADALYYAEVFTAGGADLWPNDPSAKLPGRTHVSVNTPAAYVDIPSALQAVDPIENMLATDVTDEARQAAADLERLYVAWKQDEDFDLKFHKAIITKSLYGQTAAKVYWDRERKKPCVEIIEQPRNLHLGYKSDSYTDLEWAAYVTRYEPNALIAAFGVDVESHVQTDGTNIPLVVTHDENTPPSRPWLNMGDARIEVWDYWYRQPVWRGMKFVRMDTYNVVIAGNYIVRGPIKYDEYKGELPYVPVYNTFVPGMPDGRPDLYDVEHIIREKQSLITGGSQMIANAIAGDFWQLTGPEAPMRVPAGLKPTRNTIVAPGPNARIETITPYIAQFQLEQHLGRLDREAAVETGLNDLLLGLAPAQVLSSSKAINALIANFEARISIRRKLLYKWRRDVWNRAVKVWTKFDSSVKEIVGKGAGFLDITDPSLSPRDEMETMTRAANAVNAKLASQSRAMDWIGIDDPETEKDLIRDESTDATLWPERVQVMAQLMATLQSLGLQAPAGAQAQAEGQLTSGQNDLQAALGQQTPQTLAGAPGAGGEPSMMGQTPGLPGVPPEAGGAPPFAQAQGGNEVSPPLVQGMIQNGKAKGRIMTQTRLGRR